ncbi:MAG TPA: polyprenol phosphomannose-dependent alpha 1,6 mannosyltransferase MptB, partial [Angustibacter sp.]|nr:polyprenol phosphomannose-dependent alpha 1,6 mannosyltransferase MptB [Angustibacter sp.]
MTQAPAAGRRAVAPWALAAVAIGALLLLGTAALGPSAASPALPAGTGWRAALPPWSLGIAVTSGLTTVLLDAGYVVGAVGVALGLWAAYRGETVPRTAILIACGAAVVAAFVPPLGSADHLSYAAYGRIAAAGGDPYSVPPVDWAGGHDPVTSAVEPPWTRTPSVYGPIATMVQAGTSLLGGDSVRATVWFWQLVCLAAWLAVGFMLLRISRTPQERSRAAWVWVLNPVLLGLLLVGAHVDVLAAAFGLGAIVLAVRRPLDAGALLGAAVGVKITFALVGPAVLYALWRHGRRLAWPTAVAGVVGAALVLVPAQLFVGSNLLTQLERARRYVSLASPWRPIVDEVTGPVANDVVRQWVVTLTPWVVALFVLVIAVVVHRWSSAPSRRAEAPLDPRAVTHDAATATVVLGTAYVLATPYTLPWYDALAWAPLALVAVPVLDAVLVLRLVTYAVAYVPGRVLGS